MIKFRKTVSVVALLLVNMTTMADSITFGLTDDNYDKAQDWGFIEAAIDINANTRLIVGGGANIGHFDQDHGAYIGGEYDYPINSNLALTSRAIYIANDFYGLKGLRTGFGAKYRFKKTSFYTIYRTFDNTFVDTSVSSAALDGRHETIFGALHNFNNTFAAGMDTSTDRINKAYFKITF